MAPKFPQRRLGDDLVSAVGLGCMSLGIILSSGAHNVDELLKVLTEAADMGINFWVTSNSYGTSEKVIGRWFNETGRRDEIFLATKFGVRFIDGKMGVSGKPECVKEACEASLQRLQTDHIDLYLQHRIDSQTPIEETIEAMARLKKQGKIRYLGLSECSARSLRRAHKVHPTAAAEMEFSPFALEIESAQTNFLYTARELGVKIVAYSPLGRGFLTGSIKSRDDFDVMDTRKMFPRFSEENFGDNLKLVEALASVAKEKGCTSGQLALAWVLAQGNDFIPIPGTKHITHLRENADAVNVEFSKKDDDKIRKTIESVGGSEGDRYPEAFLSVCFGDSPELGSD